MKNKSKQLKALQKLMGLVPLIKPEDINWKHPKFKEAMRQHEAFKKFMGWK